MKKTLATALAIGISAIVGLATAQAGPTERYDARTKTCRLLTFEGLREGYHLFRKDCKVCHHHGSRQGAKFLYTGSYSMDGWNRVFATRYPQCARDGQWKKFPREDLLKINDYLYANAWNASNPHCFV